MIKFLLFVKEKCSGCQKYKDLNVEGVSIINADTPEGKAMAVYYGIKVVPFMIEVGENMRKINEYRGEDINEILNKIKENS